MSFKPNPAPGSCPALPGVGLLRVAGRDAAAFLQAQAMNDVNALSPGQWQWNGLLTPKGRVIALFALLREADDQFLLVLPDYAAADMAAHLRRFVFRSKLSLATLDDWRACAGPAPEAGVANVASGGSDTGWALDVSAADTRRGWYLLPAAHPAVGAVDPRTVLAWRRADLAHGLPRIPQDQREDWTPQMLSLERISAYSLKKGCYPGQEIVARTHYLGQAKRGLARLQALAAVEPGATVQDAQDRDLGRIVCVAGDEVLAVLPADLAPGPLVAGGVPLVPCALLGGLAR